MPIDVDNETYYSVNEALEYLDIARDTLYRRIKEGRLRKYTHGVKNRVYFRLADLKALKEFRLADPDEAQTHSDKLIERE